MRKYLKSFWFLLMMSFIIAIFSSCSSVKKFTYDKGVVINGVKWATRNVDDPGFFVKEPEDAGMFYQWNRQTGWSTTDPMKNSNGGTEWDNITPAGNSWKKTNDPSPAGWRVPTLKEIQTLLDTEKVRSEWTIQKGVTGRKFTDKATGKSLFLPAAGERNGTNGTLRDADELGRYWTRTSYKNEGFEEYAYYLFFGKDISFWYYFRIHGFSIRSVAE